MPTLSYKTPSWADPQQASVLDSPLAKMVRALATLTGANDPTQVMNVGVPMAVSTPVAAEAQGALEALAERFPRLVAYIKAYHGSPHDFEKFDASKIGTGEGAQAYGHGLYFAEHPETAKAYSEQVIDHVRFDSINSRLSSLAKVMDRDSAPGQYRAFRSDAGRQAAEEYDRLMAERSAIKGKTYEVAIHADPETFLDWDKPLSQQSKPVQDVLRSLGASDPRMTGGEAYNLLGGTEGIQGAARLLQEVDRSQIPLSGIKYLDQGSRVAGEGSRNYVVFDDKTVEILRKYGLLLPAVTLGGMASQGQK